MITLRFHDSGVIERDYVGYGVSFHCASCVARVHGWIDSMTPRGLGFATMTEAEAHVKECETVE